MHPQHAYTNSIELAAALVALGFKPRKVEPVVRAIRPNGSTSDTFFFDTEARGEDFGVLSAMDVIREWAESSAKFKLKHPAAAQAIDYMRAASINRREIIAAVKANVVPTVIHNVGGRILLMPLNASPETLAAAQKMVKEVGDA